MDWGWPATFAIRSAVQESREKDKNCAREKRQGYFHAEETDTEQEADNDANARSEVLGDIVRIIDAERRKNTTTGLQDDQCPHNPVIAIEKAMLRNLLAVLIHNADQQSRE